MAAVVFKDCRFLVITAEPVEIKTGVSLLVRDRTILAADSYEALCQRFPWISREAELVDCADKIVMPGFVDGHNHLCNTHMNLARAFGVHYENAANQLLTNVHDPYGWLTEQSFYDISMASLVNDLKHGATTVENSTILPDIAYRVMHESGVRGILAGQIGTSFRLDSDDLSWKEMLARTEANIRAYHDPENGRMSVTVHIHDFWDTLETVMLRAMETAQRYDVKYVSHFWEFPDSTRRSDALWAEDGGAFLHYLKLGLINDRCVFFHGSTLNEKEIDALSETGASVIHNPDINGTNCGNCAYIPYMLAKGVNVGLGCDYGSLDMLGAMKLMLFAHNIMPRACKGMANAAPLRAATLGGARAYGLDGLIGTLEAGKRADIITFDMRTATELFPMCTSLLAYEPDLLLFLFSRNAAGLKTAETMVDGQFIRRDGRFTKLNEEEIALRANQWMERFLPDMVSKRETGLHYYRNVHDNYVRDSEVPPALWE